MLTVDLAPKCGNLVGAPSHPPVDGRIQVICMGGPEPLNRCPIFERKAFSMRISLTAAALAVLLLAAPSLEGQTNLLGKDAPDFRVGKTINESAIQTLEDAKAEVILIKYWGTK